MKEKTLKRAGSFLLALMLMASLLPGNSISAEAATPSWILPSGDPTDSMTVDQNAGFSARMQYTGIADAAGKDWTIEFDMVSNGCAIGVFQYDASGAMYCAYLDTNTGILDSVRYDDWTTCKDGFYSSVGLPGEAWAANWTEADKAKSHIRVDFVQGPGGTMAGGMVRYYKKNLTTGQYVELGKLTVSSELKDDAAEPNRFGLHLILGKAKISNMTVTERASTGWTCATDSEKQSGAATYQKATDTMTLANGDGWNSRMIYLGAADVSGKAFALEFNAEMSVGGALGVVPFYEDVDNFYGVFLDRTTKRIDGAGYSSGQLIDEFDYINTAYYASNPTQKNPVINWVRYRFEFFPGPSGTAVGGTCKLYYKIMTEGVIRDDFWRLIGTFNLPTTVVDRANKPNKIMVATRLMSATLSDFAYTEISPDTVTDYYNGPGDPAPEDGYAEESDPLPFGTEPEIAGEVAPQAMTGGGYGITTGGYTLQLYAAQSGYGTQITDASGVVVQEQVNPINIQIKKPNAADDYLGTNAETEMIAANYQAVRQKDNTLIATAQVSSKAGSRFLVTDKYIGLKDGGFQLNRNIRVISAASTDEGFNSIVKFKEKNATTYSGYEYFMPSILYRNSDNLPAGAIGKDLSLDYTWVRDNLMPTPLVMARNKTTGNSFAMGRVIDEEIYTGIDETRGSWVVSRHLDYSSTGFSNADGYVSLDLCYPGIEGNVNNLTWAIPFLRRSHPVRTDVVHSYRVLLQPGKAASFTDAMVDAYKGQFNANTVPEVEADIEKVYDVTLDYFNDFTQEYTPGRMSMPFAQYLDGDVSSLDSLIGFVGQQTTIGFHLIRNGIATNDAKQRQKGEAIIDTWVRDSFTSYGFPKIWYVTTANTWAPNSFILCYVRYMSDGMEGILDAYLEEKTAGVEKTAWLDRCKGYADWLVKAQNWDGSWYRAYNPDTGKVGEGEDGKVNKDKNNTACNVRYLVRMYEQTGKQAYLTAAIKAGQFVYNNSYLKNTYYGGTPDGLNVVDKEAGIIAMYAFNSLYQATGDSKWLKAAEHAAIFCASFVYSFDFPVWGKETYNIYRDLVGTSGISRIATGHTAVDNFSAYLYYEYFKMYIYTGDAFYYDLAKLIQDNTKQFVCIGGSLPYGRDGLTEEAHNISNMYYQDAVQACLTWCNTALIDPIGTMEDAFGVKTIQEADKLGRDVLLQKLNAYGAGGRFR